MKGLVPLLGRIGVIGETLPMKHCRGFVLEKWDSKEFIDEGDTLLVLGFCVIGL